MIHDPNILNLLQGEYSLPPGIQTDYRGQKFESYLPILISSHNTFLIQAINTNREDIFQFLITTYKEQIDVMASNNKKHTAYHLAAKQGNIKAMQSLLEIDLRGANCYDIYEQNPLHYAAKLVDKNMQILLLQHGARY